MVRATARTGPHGIAWALLLIASLAPFSGSAEPASLSIDVTPSTITPYQSGGCDNPHTAGCYRVFGVAPPATLVSVTVADEFGTTVTVTTRAMDGEERSSASWTGNEPGDWLVSPNVTALGTHGTDPSPLTYTVVVTTEEGSTLTASVQATKMAATEGDTVGPQIVLGARPTSTWCHTGIGLGCPNPTCMITSIQTTVLTGDPTAHCSRPANINGWVADDWEEARGVASEIADVVMRITRVSDEALVLEERLFVRSGTRAFYDHVVRIEEFESGQYRITVDAVDAWGNAGEPATAEFTVYPT